MLLLGGFPTHLILRRGFISPPPSQIKYKSQSHKLIKNQRRGAFHSSSESCLAFLYFAFFFSFRPPNESPTSSVTGSSFSMSNFSFISEMVIVWAFNLDFFKNRLDRHSSGILGIITASLYRLSNSLAFILNLFLIRL